MSEQRKSPFYAWLSWFMSEDPSPSALLTASSELVPGGAGGDRKVGKSTLEGPEGQNQKTKEPLAILS